MNTNETSTTGDTIGYDKWLAEEASRKRRREKSQVLLRHYLAQFQTCHQMVSRAARTFRECLLIASKECAETVDALQTLRKQTETSLHFFTSGEALFPAVASYTCATESLSLLDGEHTARLILEMDLFHALAMQPRSTESLSRARERIELHVALQVRLKDEAKVLGELIGHLEEMLTDA